MNRLRISSHEKILLGRHYRNVMSQGVKHVSRYFVLLGVHAPKRRVGIIVSKKVGGAVTRSRVKRRLRECYRQTPLWLTPSREKMWHEGSWPAMELVIIARKQATQVDFQRLSSDFVQSLIHLQERVLRESRKEKKTTQKENPTKKPNPTLHLQCSTHHLTPFKASLTL